MFFLLKILLTSMNYRKESQSFYELITFRNANTA